jgi:hypothetical protein
MKRSVPGNMRVCAARLSRFSKVLTVYYIVAVRVQSRKFFVTDDKQCHLTELIENSVATYLLEFMEFIQNKER